MPQISTDLEGKFRRKNFAEEGFFGYFFYLNLDQFSYFLMNLTAFLCHTWFEDHSWQPVPDLPRPLASLWSHPGLNSIDKLMVVRNNLFAEYVPEFCKIWCSWSNWQPFLSTSGLSITLGRLSPTYPVLWPVFGAILVRSVLKTLQMLEG